MFIGNVGDFQYWTILFHSYTEAITVKFDNFINKILINKQCVNWKCIFKKFLSGETVYNRAYYLDESQYRNSSMEFHVNIQIYNTVSTFNEIATNLRFKRTTIPLCLRSWS